MVLGVVDSLHPGKVEEEVTLRHRVAAGNSHLAKFEATLRLHAVVDTSYPAKVEEVISHPHTVAGTTPLLKVVANTSPNVVVDNMMAVRLMYQRTDTVV
jgi:adenosine/AMP kinase